MIDAELYEKGAKARAKFYAVGHLKNEFKTEDIWPLLKSMRIQDRPYYTEYLVVKGRFFVPPICHKTSRFRQHSMGVLKQAMADNLLGKRVGFDLRPHWVKALEQEPDMALRFIDEVQAFGVRPFMDFLVRTVLPDRHPGFVEAVNIHVNRRKVIDSVIDTPYIDRLHAIYHWPELQEHLSERGMAHMLEHDLGL